MSRFRLLATVMLVALCMGLHSCSKDDEEEEILLTGFDAICLEYGISDYKDIEMLHSNQFDNFTINDLPFINKTYANFCGLKNNHLWIAAFDTKTKQKLIEWTDTKEFERVRKVDLGYGEYREITVSSIYILNTLIDNNSFVSQLRINDTDDGKYLHIFKTPTSFKEVEEEELVTFIQWYKDSFFIDKNCYAYDGSIRYIAQYCPRNETAISYEEGISASTSSIRRYNHKEGKLVWSTTINPPFEVPTNAKSTITLLDRTSTIWKYKVDYIFYDGTKKDYTFLINIDKGGDTANFIGKWKVEKTNYEGETEAWDGYPYVVVTASNFYFTDEAGTAKSDNSTYTYDAKNKVINATYVNGGETYIIKVVKITDTEFQWQWDEDGKDKWTTFYCTKVK